MANRSSPATPVRVTDPGHQNDQLLYFTSSSLTADDTTLVFLSDRTGHPNLVRRDLANGQEVQLTHNTEGVLKSYVYFEGEPYAGFGKASVSLDEHRGIVYYIQGREIRAVDMAGHQRVLNKYPHGQMTAFTHVSADGERLCVPTTDHQALDGDRRLRGSLDYSIDQRIQEQGLCSYLRIYDTRTGEQVVCEPVPRAWITHVQFSPVNRDLILYNHEWPCESPGFRRIWLWDGREHHRLRNEGDGRSAKDSACHEVWQRDGRGIIYHGKLQSGHAFIGWMRPDGSDIREIPLADEYTRYGHFTGIDPSHLVSDGYYQQPDDPPSRRGAWIATLQIDWEARQIRWNPCCRHGSSWSSQDAHPHPIFNHAGDTVYFTSDLDGSRAVWCVRHPHGICGIHRQPQ